MTIKERAVQLAAELWHEAQPVRMYAIIERHFNELLDEHEEQHSCNPQGPR